MTKRNKQRKRTTAKRAFTAGHIDMIGAFAHRSARLIWSLCKSDAHYARLRDVVEQELGAYAAKHLDELHRMVNS